MWSRLIGDEGLPRETCGTDPVPLNSNLIAQAEKLGPMALGHQQGQVFMGRDFNNQPDYSDEIAFQIDKEIRRIVDESYDTAEDLLVRNRDLLNKLSVELIEYETVDAKHLKRLIEEYAVDSISPNGAVPATSLSGHRR